MGTGENRRISPDDGLAVPVRQAQIDEDQIGPVALASITPRAPFSASATR